MQQAPGYQDQEAVRRREFVPQQPGQGYAPQQAPGGVEPTTPAGAAARERIAPLALTDWVRWGPVWAGFLTVISVLAILGSLGTAIGLSVWGAGGDNAFNYGWAIFTGIVAYFLGGWLAARAAGVAGSGAGMLNGGMVWALSLLAVLLMVAVRAVNVIGAIGSNLGTALGTTTTAGTAAQAAWISFITFVVGLFLAALGGLVGARRLPGLGGRRMVR